MKHAARLGDGSDVYFLENCLRWRTLAKTARHSTPQTKEPQAARPSQSQSKTEKLPPAFVPFPPLIKPWSHLLVSSSCTPVRKCSGKTAAALCAGKHQFPGFVLGFVFRIVVVQAFRAASVNDPDLETFADVLSSSCDEVTWSFEDWMPSQSYEFWTTWKLKPFNP